MIKARTEPGLQALIGPETARAHVADTPNMSWLLPTHETNPVRPSYTELKSVSEPELASEQQQLLGMVEAVNSRNLPGSLLSSTVDILREPIDRSNPDEVADRAYVDRLFKGRLFPVIKDVDLIVPSPERFATWLNEGKAQAGRWQYAQGVNETLPDTTEPLELPVVTNPYGQMLLRQAKPTQPNQLALPAVPAQAEQSEQYAQSALAAAPAAEAAVEVPEPVVPSPVTITTTGAPLFMAARGKEVTGEVFNPFGPGAAPIDMEQYVGQNRGGSGEHATLPAASTASRSAVELYVPAQRDGRVTVGDELTPSSILSAGANRVLNTNEVSPRGRNKGRLAAVAVGSLVTGAAVIVSQTPVGEAIIAQFTR